MKTKDLTFKNIFLTFNKCYAGVFLDLKMKKKNIIHVKFPKDPQISHLMKVIQHIVTRLCQTPAEGVRMVDPDATGISTECMVYLSPGRGQHYVLP